MPIHKYIHFEWWIDVLRKNFKLIVETRQCVGETIPDSKVHGANMGPTWVLSAQGWPHIGPMNLAIRDGIIGLDSGLLPVRPQAFFWNIGGLLLIGPSGANSIWNTSIFVQWISHENDVCRMTAIFSRLQFVNYIGFSKTSIGIVTAIQSCMLVYYTNYSVMWSHSVLYLFLYIYNSAIVCGYDVLIAQPVCYLKEYYRMQLLILSVKKRHLSPWWRHQMETFSA